MSWEPEPPKRREPFLWMLGGMALTLAFIAVAVMAYMFGAGIIGPSGATPTVLPSPVPPTPIPVSTVAKQETGSLYLEYILDASGSMNEALPDGTVKLAVARDLLAQHLQAFLPETKIGLRAYGHRIDYQQAAESCQDIELIAPVETGSLPAIVGWLRGFEARGMTPLAESIRQATDDFLFEPDRINSIVMLSDGIETCEGDPCGLVRNLMVEGINFTIHVIGLDVDQPARDQLSCIAYTSGGTYHDARSEQELAKALAEIGNVLTQGQMVSPPDADTPPPEPDVTQVVLQTGTASLTPEPAPTEQASSTPQPPTPTTPPTATPLPPPPTPTVPARVLPKPIYYKEQGPHVCQGITTDFGEEYRASFDETVTEVNTCQEGNTTAENEVDVVCLQEFSDPDWVSGDLSTATWDVRTGMLVGSEGDDQIPDGVETGTTVVSLAGQEFEVMMLETFYRDEWVDEGNNWWEDASCTYYEHANNLTVQWMCHTDVYVLWEGRTIHVFTCDSDIRLTETNLDL